MTGTSPGIREGLEVSPRASLPAEAPRRSEHRPDDPRPTMAELHHGRERPVTSEEDDRGENDLERRSP
jgi:hypothetical protein